MREVSVVVAFERVVLRHCFSSLFSALLLHGEVSAAEVHVKQYLTYANAVELDHPRELF